MEWIFYSGAAFCGVQKGLARE